MGMERGYLAVLENQPAFVGSASFRRARGCRLGGCGGPCRVPQVGAEFAIHTYVVVWRRHRLRPSMRIPRPTTLFSPENESKGLFVLLMSFSRFAWPAISRCTVVYERWFSSLGRESTFRRARLHPVA